MVGSLIEVSSSIQILRKSYCLNCCVISLLCLCSTRCSSSGGGVDELIWSLLLKVLNLAWCWNSRCCFLLVSRIVSLSFGLPILFSVAFAVSFHLFLYRLGWFIFAHPASALFIISRCVLSSWLPCLCFACPLLFLSWMFFRFVVVLVCRCWALVCMVSLLYESPGGNQVDGLPPA